MRLCIALFSKTPAWYNFCMDGEQGIGAESELAPEWQEAIREGVTDSLDNFDLIYFPQDPNSPQTPLNFAPISYGVANDDRLWSDLSDKEREFIKGVFFEELGVDEEHAEIKSQRLTYSTQLLKQTGADKPA